MVCAIRAKPAWLSPGSTTRAAREVFSPCRFSQATGRAWPVFVVPQLGAVPRRAPCNARLERQPGSHAGLA